MANLADRNGLALDGTPTVTALSELQALHDDGFVLLQKRPQHFVDAFVPLQNTGDSS